ncbi:MAG: metal ABC transporter ATP-binding protein [Syntrophorhabdaceae bacterium]|nr:metal ABC transporter ATP-binding protein [Syntrophorhabdaceae bacterium]
MSIEVLSVKDLSFRYNSTEVLSGVSFSLKSGDYLAIVGPNGSGKTTLIKTVLGFFEPSAGSVSLFGSSPSRFNNWEKIGYLPQKLASLNPNFPATVKEIVALGLLSKKGFPKKISLSDQEAIDYALSLMDIIHIKDEFIGELSGGQQQRALIAKALVSEPELLILDEPTTALDPEGRERFFETLQILNNQKNLTIIIITHDIGTIGRYASRLLYLDKKVIFYGGFDDFCISKEMTDYFGEFSQHIICHRHDYGHA